MGSGSGRIPTFRTVLLVGFMGSGKTTVGRRVAASLDWEFVDLDERIERERGLSVAEIFRREGEAAFRDLEEAAARDALDGAERVVAPGGGWAAAAPTRLSALPDDVLSVWLRVDASTALRRVERDLTVRPLLAGDDPVRTAEALLQRRDPLYRRARLHLDTRDTSPERLAGAIVEYVLDGEADTNG